MDTWKAVEVGYFHKVAYQFFLQCHLYYSSFGQIKRKNDSLQLVVYMVLHILFMGKNPIGYKPVSQKNNTDLLGLGNPTQWEILPAK